MIGLVEKWTNPLLASSTQKQPICTVTVFTDLDLVSQTSPLPKTSSSFLPVSIASVTETSNRTAERPKSPVAESSFESKVHVEPPQVNLSSEVADAEDHTINTKLALEDIEKMFAEDDFFVSYYCDIFLYSSLVS